MKSGLPWFDNMVNRTNSTLALPCDGVSVVNWCSGSGCWRLIALTNGPEAFFVSILKAFTAAVESSPQISDGSTAKFVISTACGSRIVICRDPPTPLEWLFGESLPQPVSWDRSIAPPGPQSNGV